MIKETCFYTIHVRIPYCFHRYHISPILVSFFLYFSLHNVNFRAAFNITQVSINNVHVDKNAIEFHIIYYYTRNV